MTADRQLKRLLLHMRVTYPGAWPPRLGQGKSSQRGGEARAVYVRAGKALGLKNQDLARAVGVRAYRNTIPHWRRAYAAPPEAVRDAIAAAAIPDNGLAKFTTSELLIELIRRL